MGVVPPAGLATLSAILERDGVADVEILDAQALGLDVDEVVAEAGARAPDWIGLTASTPIVKNAYAIARGVRRLLPGARIVLGGPHPSILPDEALAEPAVDCVLVGEAETTLPRLVAGDAPETIPGLVWRGPQGDIVRNPLPPLVEDLDSLPDPAFEKLPIERYRPSLGNYLHLPALGFTATRGCYAKCTFCNQNIFGSRVRTLPAERLVAFVESLRDRYGVREVQFYDDVFLGTKKRIRGFCEAMIARRVGVSWSCFMRAELTDAETASLMKRAGCYLVLFGIESADPSVLGEMRKNVSLDRTREALAVFRREGVLLKCGFILGYPGETRETMRRTVDLALEIAPHAAAFNLATPFPGTQLYSRCLEEGTLESTDWDDYDQAHALIAIPGVSRQELLDLYRGAYRRFYLRPGAVLRWAARVRSWDQLAMMTRAFLRIVSLVFLERGRLPRRAPGAGTERQGQAPP